MAMSISSQCMELRESPVTSLWSLDRLVIAVSWRFGGSQTHEQSRELTAGNWVVCWSAWKRWEKSLALQEPVPKKEEAQRSTVSLVSWCKIGCPILKQNRMKCVSTLKGSPDLQNRSWSIHGDSCLSHKNFDPYKVNHWTSGLSDKAKRGAIPSGIVSS